MGYSPWGREESDTTEWLHFHFSLSCIGEGNGNPLQRSCLENPRDGGAWWAASMGWHRVGHDWSDLAAAACTYSMPYIVLGAIWWMHKYKMGSLAQISLIWKPISSKVASASLSNKEWFPCGEKVSEVQSPHFAHLLPDSCSPTRDSQLHPTLTWGRGPPWSVSNALSQSCMWLVP